MQWKGRRGERRVASRYVTSRRPVWYWNVDDLIIIGTGLDSLAEGEPIDIAFWKFNVDKWKGEEASEKIKPRRAEPNSELNSFQSAARGSLFHFNPCRRQLLYFNSTFSSPLMSPPAASPDPQLPVRQYSISNVVPRHLLCSPREWYVQDIGQVHRHKIVPLFFASARSRFSVTLWSRLISIGNETCKCSIVPSGDIVRSFAPATFLSATVWLFVDSVARRVNYNYGVYATYTPPLKILGHFYF